MVINPNLFEFPWRKGIGLVILVMLPGLPRTSTAQRNAGGRQFIQTGLAVFPGAGLQLGYVDPRSIYTVEGMLYADGQPALGEGESTLRLSVGAGAALRPLGVVRTLGNADYRYDFDFGVRFGPSLFFTTGATRSDKNQQFSLFLDFFVRFSSRLRSGRIFYLELGPQQPVFRLGLWFGLG